MACGKVHEMYKKGYLPCLNHSVIFKKKKKNPEGKKKAKIRTVMSISLFYENQHS